jgi:hypothetical protein
MGEARHALFSGLAVGGGGGGLVVMTHASLTCASGRFALEMKTLQQETVAVEF